MLLIESLKFIRDMKLYNIAGVVLDCNTTIWWIMDKSKTLMFSEKVILKLGDDSMTGKPRKIKESYKTVVSLLAKMNGLKAN